MVLTNRERIGRMLDVVDRILMEGWPRSTKQPGWRTSASTLTNVPRPPLAPWLGH
jgi:hypothetical protein